MSFAGHHPLVNVFLLISIFRRGPQDLPASQFLFVIVFGLNVLLGVASFTIEFDLGQALIRVCTDMVVSLGLVYLLLWVVGKQARILQTLTALIGVGVILNMLSLPLLYLFGNTQNPSAMVVALLYFVFLWNIAITGHIFGRALSVRFTVGVLAALTYILITVLIFYTLFPVQ